MRSFLFANQSCDKQKTAVRRQPGGIRYFFEILDTSFSTALYRHTTVYTMPIIITNEGFATIKTSWVPKIRN